MLFTKDLDIRSSDHVLEETAARRTRKPAGADRQVATLAILEEDCSSLLASKFLPHIGSTSSREALEAGSGRRASNIVNTAYIGGPNWRFKGADVASGGKTGAVSVAACVSV